MPSSLVFNTHGTIVLEPSLAPRRASLTVGSHRHPTTGRSNGDAVRLDSDEVQLLRLLATEIPVESLARTLDMSERTVRRRSRALYDKLGVAGRVEAAVWATRHGVL